MKLLCHRDTSFPNPLYKRALYNGSAFELFDYDTESDAIIGSIFQGRIVKRHVEFALIDIGLSRPALLPLSKNHSFVEGDDIVVQIKREAWRDKGESHWSADLKAPQVTDKIEIVTPYFVYSPGGESAISFSKNAKSSQNLTDLGQDFIVQENGRLTFRSHTASASAGHIEGALSYLKQIIHTLKSSPNVGLLHKGRKQLERILDQYRPSEILCNSIEDYKAAELFLSLYPYEGNVKLLHTDFFHEYDATEGFDQALSPWVSLPCGGQLVIEFTSAVVSIDVNRAKASSLITVNEEAMNAIPNLLKQFNVCGNIIVDFAGNMPPHKKKEILAFFQRNLPKDTLHCGWSSMGWFEIRRPKTRMSLFEKFAQ